MEFPFIDDGHSTPKERFRAILELQSNYDDAIGEAVAEALLVEKNIHLVRALTLVAFPVWLPKVDNKFLDAKVWPLDPYLSQGVIGRCQYNRIRSFERVVPQWMKSEDFSEFAAATYYFLAHNAQGPEIPILVANFEARARGVENLERVVTEGALKYILEAPARWETGWA